MTRLKRRRILFRERMLFWMIGYPTYCVGALIYGLLRVTGRIRIRHPERWPYGKGKVIIAPNHPSLWEPMVCMLLSPWEGLLHPTRMVPWSTPDAGNYDRWYWVLARSRFVFVPRGQPRGEVQALAKVVRLLRIGSRVIIFPEGGRTHKGVKFHYSKSRKHRVRELKNGLARAACDSGATIVTVWIDGADRVLPAGSVIPLLWRRITITIGEPIKVPRTFLKGDERTRHVAAKTQEVRGRLLALAEEED
ncbi:MAG: lysophospholipid acyltransferase family protein [Candidatus Paceibacterota bacterium]